jgi:hypothetical protein
MDKQKYAIFFPIILFIVFDISALLINYWISDSLSKSALTINLAGRQRMLSQRISKSLLLVKLGPTDTEKQTARTELKTAIQLFDNTLKAFEEGGNTLDGDHKPVFISAIKPSQARELIEKPTPKAGLKVFACIFNKVYKTCRKVAEGFKESMRIVFDEPLRQWTYTAIPDATTL